MIQLLELPCSSVCLWNITRLALLLSFGQWHCEFMRTQAQGGGREHQSTWKEGTLSPQTFMFAIPLLILCPPNIHDCWPLLAVKPHLSFNLGLEVRVYDWDLSRHVPASLDKLTGMSWQSPLWAITLHSPLPPLMLGWGTDLTEGRYPQVKNCFKLTLHR